EPLAEPAGRVADSLNDVASVMIDVLAGALSGIAQLISPIAEGFANLMDVIDPGVFAAAAVAIVSLHAGIKLLNGASGLLGAANAALVAHGSFGKLTAATGIAEQATGRFAGTLKGIAGKAGLIGGVAVAVGLALPALKEWGDQLNGYADNARIAASSNLSLEDSVKKVVSGNKMYSEAFTDSRVALEQLVEVENRGRFARWVGDLGQASRESHALSIGRQQMDSAIPGLPQQDAVAKCNGWAESAGATEEEIAGRLRAMLQLSQ